MAKIGRRSTFNFELAEEICLKVSTSPRMLEQLCKEHPHWPIANTIYEWRIKYPLFGEMYTRAKQAQIEPLVNHIFVLLREKSDDYYEDREGKRCIDHAHLNKLRIEIDAIKWLAAKLAPKLYGERNVVKSNDNEDAISKFRVDE